MGSGPGTKSAVVTGAVLALSGVSMLTSDRSSKGEIALEMGVSPIVFYDPDATPQSVDIRRLCDSASRWTDRAISVEGDLLISRGGSADGTVFAYDLQKTITYQHYEYDAPWLDKSAVHGPFTIAVVSAEPLKISGPVRVDGVWKEEKGVYFLVPQGLTELQQPVPQNERE